METEQKPDFDIEKDHWIGWLKKRMDMTPFQQGLITFALGELQSHCKSLQEENKRLKENYDHSQRVLDSYRKLLEEEKNK